MVRRHVAGAGETVTFTWRRRSIAAVAHLRRHVTVTDGKGGKTTDVVNIVVEDTDGPALQGLPRPRDAPAMSSAGATFTFGPVAGADAVDGVAASARAGPVRFRRRHRCRLHLERFAWQYDELRALP